MGNFLPFVSNEHPTIGVEQEFHLVDPETGQLRPACEDVISKLPESLKNQVTRELKLCVIEGQSEVCETVDELVQSVVSLRQSISKACKKTGVRLAAAGCHPFPDWHNQPYVDDGHYRWVAQETGYLTDRMMAFGLHVHIGMRGPEEALYAMHEFKRWVYPLLALSANSPYFEGRDTGLDSVRLHLFQSLPRTSLPPSVESLEELEDLYTRLNGTKDVTRPGDLWWMIRPQPPLGTIEVRAYDLPTASQRVGVLSAITQATMAYYQDQAEAGEPRSDFVAEYLEENAWKAMRYGLDCDILEPESGEKVSMRSQIERLLQTIGPHAERLECKEYVQEAYEILNDGNEATQQRRWTDSPDADLVSLEREIVRRTISG